MNLYNYNAFLTEALIQTKEEFNQKEHEAEFFMLFSNLEYIESDELKIIASVPSKFIYERLINGKHIIELEKKLYELSGQNIKIELKISQKKSPENKTSNSLVENSFSSSKNETVKETEEKPRHPQLNPRYTFENFVKGANNEFALNGSIAVSRNPGKVYNPVLIYGGVGLGKTHLMQSIGNEIYKKSDSKIICITAEDFTNEFMQALNSGTTQKFKNKYRQADVLLIDDIHFLIGKEETQQELFYTFEALYNNNKQMVFTCDRPAKELKGITDRLRNRFERGLNVDLQVPQYETRRAILEKKVNLEHLNIDSDVLDLIAKNISTNVRDLESALTTIKAYEELMGQHVTLEIAQKQLKNMISDSKDTSITIETIQKVIANQYGLSVSELKGKSRKKSVIIPRHYAIYLSKELTEYSTTEIGSEFGGRDHTTALNSLKKVEEMKITDPSTEQILSLLTQKIKEFKNK